MEAFWTFLFSIIERLYLWRLIQPDEGGVRTTFGRFPKVLSNGIHWVCPLVGEIRVVQVNESVLDIRTQSLRTRDGVSVVAGVTVSYKIINPYKALIKIRDWESSMSNEILSIVGREVRKRRLDELGGEELPDAVRAGLRGVATKGWGISILRVGGSDFDKSRSFRVMGIGDGST